MTFPWTYEEKLAQWGQAGQRARDDQWAQNERDADAVLVMTDKEVKALALAEFGSAALVKRSTAMTKCVIETALAKHWKH